TIAGRRHEQIARVNGLKAVLVVPQEAAQPMHPPDQDWVGSSLWVASFTARDQLETVGEHDEVRPALLPGGVQGKLQFAARAGGQLGVAIMPRPVLEEALRELPDPLGPEWLKLGPTASLLRQTATGRHTSVQAQVKGEADPGQRTQGVAVGP